VYCSGRTIIHRRTEGGVLKTSAAMVAVRSAASVYGVERLFLFVFPVITFIRPVLILDEEVGGLWGGKSTGRGHDVDGEEKISY